MFGPQTASSLSQQGVEWLSVAGFYLQTNLKKGAQWISLSLLFLRVALRWIHPLEHMYSPKPPESQPRTECLRIYETVRKAKKTTFPIFLIKKSLLGGGPLVSGHDIGK